MSKKPQGCKCVDPPKACSLHYFAPDMLRMLQDLADPNRYYIKYELGTEGFNKLKELIKNASSQQS